MTDPTVQEELRRELLWTSGRPKSKVSLGLSSAGASSDAFGAAQTLKEDEFEALYKEGNPNGVWMLNQNMDAGFAGMQSTVGPFGTPIMYTIIHNAALHKSGIHGRWASALEMLVFLGFPVTPELGSVVGAGGAPARLCSFCAGGNLSGRQRNKIIGMAGNSQHVAINVVLKLIAILFCRRDSL